MDPYHMGAPPPASRAEAERWLAIAEKLLAGRDLVGSKTFAIRARESDPRLEAAEQILAVADTLIAADKRLNGQPDWYSILQVPFLASDLDLIAAHYRRLAILLNPSRSRLAFADEAFQLVSDAWSVLSNPNHKSMYDSQVTFIPPPPPQQHQPHPNLPPHPNIPISNNSAVINNNADYNSNNVGNVDVNNNNNNRESELGETFWTACPYCYNMYEYPSAYEECTMRCQNCRRAFHGAKIAAPPVNDGETYLTWGFYPLGVSMSMMEKNKGGVPNWTPFSPMFSCPIGEVKRKAGRPPGPVVYIDDDEDDDFLDDSEPSEDSDDEWGSTRTRKKKSSHGRRGRPRKKALGENAGVYPEEAVEVLEVGPKAHEGSAPQAGAVNSGMAGAVNSGMAGSVNPGMAGAVNSGMAGSVNPGTAGSVNWGTAGAVNSGKAGVTLGKKPGKALKELGKLDLNVEFSNEVEEPTALKAAREGVARQANGEEDAGVEGIGFFEGLDEFLSSLPILNVVGDDKVKAA